MSLAGGRIDTNEFTPPIAKFLRISEMRSTRGTPVWGHPGIEYHFVLVDDEETLGMRVQRVPRRRSVSLSRGQGQPKSCRKEQSKRPSRLSLPVSLPGQELQVRHAWSPSGLIKELTAAPRKRGTAVTGTN